MTAETRTVGALLESAQAAESAGDLDEALALYESALERVVPEENRGRSAELLRKIGRVHFERGAYDRASELYEASLAMAQAGELRQHTAAALNGMASTAQMRGRLDMAELLYRQAEGEAARAGDRRLTAAVQQNLGTVAGIRGQIVEAQDRFRRAAELLRELGDERSAAQAFNNLGIVSVDIADWGAAEISFAAARELAERAADPRVLAAVHVNRAEMCVLRQNYEAARESCDAARELFSRLGSESGLADVHKLLGAVSRETGQIRRSEVELRLALNLAHSCGNQLLEAEVENESARLFVLQGRTRDALRALNRAFRLFELTEARREVHDVQRRLDMLEDSYFRTLQLLELESVEASDAHTSGRYERVAELACRLASTLGCTGKDLTWLRVASYLYDVGKASLPAELLNKPGALDAAEWEAMRTHPVAGEEIAGELEFPAHVRALVRSHHEHWDGSGYPDGLKGEEIPLHARILGMADAFAALTSDRSFRRAFTPEQALETMQSEAGQVFDPELFRVFRTVATTRPASM